MGSLGDFSSRSQCRLQELVSQSQVLDVNVADERRQLFDLVQSLCAELETPMESIYRLTVIQPILYMSVRIAVNLNLFDVLAQDGSAPKTVKHLAAAVGTDETLLGRILKNTAASDLIRETTPGTYEHTSLSTSLLNLSYRDGFFF